MTGRTGIIAVSLLIVGIFPGYFCYQQDGTPICKHAEIVERADWKARPEVRRQYLLLPVSHVIILDTVTRECQTYYQCVRAVQFIQDFHLDYRGWWDIGYNFLIGGDGRVYVGRGWDVIGAHSHNYNSKSIGIAFIGNYKEIAPPKIMLDAALAIIDCCVELGILTPSREIHGHRDVSCSDSPGEKLYKIIRTWKNYKGGLMDDYICQPPSN